MRPRQPTPRNPLPRTAAILLFCIVAIRANAESPAGEKTFRDQCARCHGTSGEGTDDYYPDPLAGDKSVAQLTKLIHETMPDDADKKCSAEDAAKVAIYIYDSF